MVPYLGDFPEDFDSVQIPFNSFSSANPSASVTITDLADADIMVHKDSGLTQIATDGATVIIDFDGIIGNHMIQIDTSVSADYSTGSEYAVRVEGVTIDGATINAWIGAFSIERAGGALAIVKQIQTGTVATTSDNGTAQAGSLSNITLRAGASAIDNTYSGQIVSITAGTGAGQARAAGGYVGLTKVLDVISDWVIAPDATSVYAILPDEVTGLTAPPTVAEITADMDANSTELAALKAGIIFGACTATTLSTSQCSTDLTGYLDNELIDAVVIWTGGVANGQRRTITANTAANGLLTFAPVLITAPADTDPFKIV